MKDKGIIMPIVFGVLFCFLQGCSNSVAPATSDIVSIEYVSTGQFGSQTLTASRFSIRYVKSVPNFPQLAKDTVVQDSAFLAATLKGVDMRLLLLQGDALDGAKLSLDEGFSIMRVTFQRTSDLNEIVKVIQYTYPPPSSLFALDRAMTEKLIQIRDN